jgi:putative DNA primase/helicase
VAGFPLVNDADKSVALSGLISPVVRGAMSVVPLHAFSAPVAGTGKSFLVDLASAIATGRICPVAAAGENPDETEKRLIGLLLASFPVISLDNLSAPLGGDVLCQAVERPMVRLRPLGSSEMIEIENRATCYATGNALVATQDMTRRTLRANLDAEMERPETRTFKFDPVELVFADRGKYVAACLTIVRAYLLSGEPQDFTPLQSFTAWDRTVRGALIWLGKADPASTIEATRDDDPTLIPLRNLLTAWFAYYGDKEKSIAEVIKDIECIDPNGTHGDRLMDLRAALAAVAGTRGGTIESDRLRYWLREKKKVITLGMKFITADTIVHGGGAKWKVIKC